MSTPSSKTPALRPYLEAITEHCSGLSKEEVLEVLLGIAQDIPQNQRADFLKKFPGLSKQMLAFKPSGRDLLTKIRDLKVDVQARSRSIEDGDFYDEEENWGMYDDEGPPDLTEEMKTDLESLFREADKIFWSGHFEEAKVVYRELLHFMGNAEDQEVDSEPPIFTSGRIDYHVEIDCREVRARYARSIVETQSDSKKLAKELLQAMEARAAVNPYKLDLSEEKEPMLQDVMDAKKGALSRWDAFLDEWKRDLAPQESSRARLLLMEAVMMTDGLEGVTLLAKKWGAQEPRGYLYWIQQLQKASDEKNRGAVCLEALKNIAQNTFRDQISEYLIEAARAIGEPKMLLTGLREKFLATLRRADLASCLAEAERQGERQSEISAILRKVSGLKDQKPLLVLLLILAGKLDQAFDEVKKDKVAGWSGEGNGAGLFLSSVLTILSRSHSRDAVVISALLERYADERNDDTRKVFREKTASIVTEIQKSLQDLSASPRQREEWMAWAHGIAMRRIDHIVTNKHRRAYGRAAELLGAMVEHHMVQGEKGKAVELLRENRDKRYNRFYAFKQELQALIKSSKLLQQIQ